jgi:hypothetical protein
MTPRPLGAVASLEAPKTPLEVENAIRARAYELYEERGGEPGHDVEDWLRAEEEIRELQATVTAAKSIEAPSQPRPSRSNGGSVFATSS